MTQEDKNQLIATQTAIEKIQQELHELSTVELRDQLAGQLQLTADHLLRLALIIRELEDRGEDLSNFRLGLMPYLRQIAYGQVAPEIVVRYAGFPSLIQRVSRFPMPDQVRIASGEPVPLVVLRGEKTDVRQVDPLHLTREQLHQVFAQDHIRSVSEQAVIAEQRLLEPPKPVRTKRSRVKADPERSGIRIGRAFGALEEVLAALAQLSEADYDETSEGEATLVIKLSAAQHQQLKVRAARSSASMNDLARRALAAAGLLKPVE